MQSYRVYFQGPDGDVDGADAFECDADNEAIEIGRQRAGGRPMELWQQARRLISFS